MTPGCDSRGRNDVRGRGGPSGGRWAGCGSTTSPTMQSSMAPSQVVLGGRKVAIRRPRVRRDGAELRIQRGALRSTTRRSSSMPGSGSDAPICQDSRSRRQVCGLARSVVCHHALKNLAGEKAFETADDLPFGPPFSGASFDVVEGW